MCPLFDLGSAACTARTAAACVTVAAIHINVRACGLMGGTRRCGPAEHTSVAAVPGLGAGRGLFTVQLSPIPVFVPVPLPSLEILT